MRRKFSPNTVKVKNTYINVQLGFMRNMDDNVCKGFGFFHGLGFERSQSMSACIRLQEEIVLLHIVDKTLLR